MSFLAYMMGKVGTPSGLDTPGRKCCMSLSKYLLNAQTYTVKIDAPPVNLEKVNVTLIKKSIQNFT